MSKKQLCLLLLISLVQLSSCSYPSDNQPIPISKAAMFSPKSMEKANSIAFIYEYNSKRSKLEWKACRMAKSSGDQLTDAINTFIQTNIERGTCKALKLQKIDKNKHPVLISFSGKPEFKNKKEQQIFLTALEMTISRNADQEDIDIKFNR